ncbi:MAG: HD domain-containing phosphohydrolase [Oleiphilus sp.]
MSITKCPDFTELDSEIIADFSECLHENIEQIEAVIALLDRGYSSELINRLFRDVHSLKGNCRMVFLDPLVETIHALEEIVSDMREEIVRYNQLYGEFIIAVVMRINQMIQDLVNHGQVEGAPQELMLEVIEHVHQSDPQKQTDALNKALDDLAGNKQAKQAEEPSKTSTENKAEPKELVAEAKGESHPDLIFFKKLALQLDEISIYKRGRTQDILDLCHSTNERLGNIVDSDQLSAAIYLHDLGMSLVPAEILNKPGKLTKEEFQLIRNHIEMGAEILGRIPGWEEASIMVQQHHEKYNGTGYPDKLCKDDIHPGARIIALADTFYAITNERADRSYKKSLFSAVTLINGESGLQFDPKFVEAFNDTIRRHYVAQK